MCKELFLSWQSSKTREWFPVARLSKIGEEFSFRYTKGAKEAKASGFVGLAGFSSFDKLYLSNTIFPVLQNRIMNKSRPDRDEYLSWLGLDSETHSDFEELARTGGVKATDNLQLYPIPEPKNGLYQFQFFVHGISHLPENYKDRTYRLQPDDSLFLMPDVQNQQSKDAISLRTEDPVELVGYVPKFFTQDFIALFRANPNQFNIKVKKLNVDAPEQFALLCELTAPWPDDFKPLNNASFKALVNP